MVQAETHDMGKINKRMKSRAQNPMAVIKACVAFSAVMVNHVPDARRKSAADSISNCSFPSATAATATVAVNLVDSH
jgi:hypothetical protein